MELHDAEEATEMRKILAHDMRMNKNPQTTEDTFWIFRDYHRVMRVQGLTCTLARKSLSPKSSICCYFFKYFVLINLKRKKKKALTLTENLWNFYVTCMDPKQTFERFLKMDALSSDFLGVDAFLPI